MSKNAPITSPQILGNIEDQIRSVLPSEWSLSLERETNGRSPRSKARLVLIAPDDETVTYVLEVRRLITAQSLTSAIGHLNRHIDESHPQALPLLVAAYLSPASKETLIKKGISYADSTGNLRLVANRPGLFLNQIGATKDPWPDDKPLRSLKGRAAGRSIRALVDYQPPYGVRELSLRAKLSSATLSRVIELLEREAVLTKDIGGGVFDLDWEAAIRRWSQEYELRRSAVVASYLEPRGLGTFAEKLKNVHCRYAITSSLAAQRYAPVAPTRTAVVYVENAKESAALLNLRPADTGANVLLVEPFDDVVFDRTTVRDELVTAAPSQVVVDLMTGPGREPSEAEELINWMKENEVVWRA